MDQLNKDTLHMPNHVENFTVGLTCNDDVFAIILQINQIQLS